ncbi:MAG: sensor histidine kinase [Thermoanaerobaculia bacterium]
MQNRLIRVAGVVTWIAVGIPVILYGATSPALMAGWAVAFAAFGAGLLMNAPPRSAAPHLALQTASVLVMVLLLCNGFEGTLLVLVAMQLGGVMSRRAGIAWIVVQTILLYAAIAIHWSPRPATLLTPPYLGFQLLAFFTFEALARESAARRELRAINEILADSSRIAERLRISRELHDALGHHLTALSLNLEAALQKTDGDARSRVQTAQTLAKSLLSDVRDIAAAMHDDNGVDLEHALRPLVDDEPRPHIHLEVEDGIRIGDPERAHVIVRCTQEIVTNAAKHSSAENLWIVIGRDGDDVRIHARDDGRGTAQVPEGFGLRSMRDRLAEAGGDLRVDTRPGFGFEVIARVPVGSAPV